MQEDNLRVFHFLEGQTDEIFVRASNMLIIIHAFIALLGWTLLRITHVTLPYIWHMDLLLLREVLLIVWGSVSRLGFLG